MEFGGEVVTVILPVYNGEEFLEETLWSVVNQSFTLWELIIVDDCSTDNSNAIINKMVMRLHGKIRVLTNSENKGVAYCRNLGIQLSKTDYIAFIDADDIWDRSKLEKQISAMERLNCNISSTDVILISDTIRSVSLKERRYKRVLNLNDMLANNELALSSVVLRKSEFCNLEFPNLRTRQDWALWIKLWKFHKVRHVAISELLVNYRIRKGSLSRNKLKTISNYYNVFRVNGYCKLSAILYVIRYAISKSIKTIHNKNSYTII